MIVELLIKDLKILKISGNEIDVSVVIGEKEIYV